MRWMLAYRSGWESVDLTFKSFKSTERYLSDCESELVEEKNNRTELFECDPTTSSARGYGRKNPFEFEKFIVIGTVRNKRELIISVRSGWYHNTTISNVSFDSLIFPFSMHVFDRITRRSTNTRRKLVRNCRIFPLTIKQRRRHSHRLFSLAPLSTTRVSFLSSSPTVWRCDYF